MKLVNFKTITALLLTCFLYVFFSLLVVKPHNLDNFSFIDDPFVLFESNKYMEDCFNGGSCDNLVGQVFEAGTSRFRPFYWVINSLIVFIFGNNPLAHHSFRIFFVGLVSVLLISINIYISTRKLFLSILGSLFLFTNISFTENIVRLGTNEPYQIFFLGLIYLYIQTHIGRSNPKLIISNRDSYLFWLLLLPFILIKENGFVLLGAIYVLDAFRNKKIILTKYIKHYLVLFFFIMLMAFVAKNSSITTLASFPSYVSNYTFKIASIFSNGLSIFSILKNNMYPLLQILFFLLAFLVISRDKKPFKNLELLFWVTFFVLITAIQLPWKFVLDRYYLLSVYSIIIIFMLVVSESLNLLYIKLKINEFKSRKISFGIFLGLLLPNIYFLNFPINYAKGANYANWFSEFTRFESDQVRSMYECNVELISINASDGVNNLEMLFGIPYYSEFVYSKKVVVTNKNIYSQGCIIQRTTSSQLEEYANIEKLFPKLLKRGDYFIRQIDPVRFREEFKYRPLHAIYNPPFQKETINYNWEIRKI